MCLSDEKAVRGYNGTCHVARGMVSEHASVEMNALLRTTMDSPLLKKKCVLWYSRHAEVHCIACVRKKNGDLVTAWGGGSTHPWKSFLFVLRECTDGDDSLQELKYPDDEDEDEMGWVLSVALSHDGLTLFSSSNGTQDVLVWDIGAANPRVIKRLKGHYSCKGCIIAAAVDIDAHQWVVSGSRDYRGAVFLWRLDIAEIVYTLWHGWRVFVVSISHDARFCASGGGCDNAVKLWDTRSGKCVHTLGGHSGNVYIISFCRDARRLASACLNGSIYVWDYRRGTCLQEQRGKAYSICRCLWSADDRFIVSCGRKATLRVWNPDTGKVVGTIVNKHFDGGCLCVDPSTDTYTSGSTYFSVIRWTTAGFFKSIGALCVCVSHIPDLILLLLPPC